MPRNVLDLAISKKIQKNFEVKISVKDIFNQKFVLKQTVDTSVDMNEITKGSSSGVEYFKRDQITKSYQPGRYLSMGITYKF